MRVFVIIATLMAVAIASPDIGLNLRKGYTYSAGSAGSGQGHYSNGGGGYSNGNGGAYTNGNGHGSNGHGSGNGHGASYTSTRFSGGSGSFGGSNGGSYNGGSSGGNGFSSGGSYSGGSSDGFGSDLGGGGGSFGGGSGGGGSGGSGGITYGRSEVINLGHGTGGGGTIVKPVIRHGAPEITKHFYVHEAPEEPSDVRIQEKVINVRPQKHYKILFIKAPHQQGAYGGSSVPIYPQNEEKTIVYVLSKKNEALNEHGEFPTPPAPVTSKPEVFFVKYNNKQEAENAVAKIQESFKEGGPGYHSPGSFAKSIGATSAGSGSSSFTSGSTGSSFGGSTGSSFGGSTGSGFGSSSRFGGSSSTGSGSTFGSTGTASKLTGTGTSSGAYKSGAYNSGAYKSTTTTNGNGGKYSSGSGFASGATSLVLPQTMIEVQDSLPFETEYLPANKKK